MMSDPADGELLLCCMLWAHDGQAESLAEYEDRVLEFVPQYDGQVVQRVVSDGSDGHPHEVQLFRFASQAKLDSYLADPRRAALAKERDRSIARTELFPVRFLPVA